MEGRGLMVAIDLQRLGLIEGVGAFGTQHYFTIGDGGTVGIFGRKYALRLSGKPGTKVQFPAILLTRMGKEVMSLLDVSGERQSMRELVELLKSPGVTEVALGTFVAYGATAKYSVEEILYTAPE